MTMVTKLTGPRRERKKAAIRAKIIGTAVELFSRHGFADVTVEHIADVADIGKGTVYNYFPAKEDIVVAYMTDLERDLQARTMRFAHSSGSLDSILSGFILFQLRLKKRYHPFVRVFLAQMFLRTREFLPYLIEMQKAIDPPLEALFRGIQERGLMRKDMPLAEIIHIFKTIQLGLTALWAIEGPPFHATEKTVKQEMKLFCEGLKGRKR
jgi:AcrR family transcriptional regulator